VDDVNLDPLKEEIYKEHFERENVHLISGCMEEKIVC
jgi:hypothetical protein